MKETPPKMGGPPLKPPRSPLQVQINHYVGLVRRQTKELVAK